MHLIPGPTRFLPGIWIQKLKYKNMFILGSYRVSIRHLASCEFLRGSSSVTGQKIRISNREEKRALHDFFEEEEGVLYGPGVAD